jgi:hypothetical protein
LRKTKQNSKQRTKKNTASPQLILSIRLADQVLIQKRSDSVLVMQMETNELLSVEGDARHILLCLQARNERNKSATFAEVKKFVLKASKEFQNNPDPEETLMVALEELRNYDAVVY